MPSNNNKDNQYDPSRLIFAPGAVKAEPTSTNRAGPVRLGSLRPTGQFGPPTSSNTMMDASTTRRFMPKVGTSTSRRRIFTSTMSSDINDHDTFDLLNNPMDGEKRGSSRARGGGDSGRGRRRMIDNIVHMNPTHTFGDQKTFKEDPMIIDSSSDDEGKVDIKKEKTESELHAEYFDGIINPPLKLITDEEEKEEVLFGPNSNLKEDELFFIQLPSHLPTFASERKVNKKQQSVDDEYEDTWNKEFENSLSDIKEGQLGVMKVYKSGKTKLELRTKEGKTILFDVLTSQNHSFCEDVTSIDTESKSCYMLGPVAKRVTCIPDCETLLGMNHNIEE